MSTQAVNTSKFQDPLVAIRRQAKRLHTRLDIPLTYAKDFLARCAYQCAGWGELEAKLSSPPPHSEALLLAHMPGSDEAQTYFRRQVLFIGRAIGRELLTNRNLAGMWEVLHFVFDEECVQAELTDVADGIGDLTWFSADIGPDPYAVIQSHVRVGGITMKLIGTRVYLPQFLSLEEELDGIAHLASHTGTTLEIMWERPKDWHAAAHAYLSALDDEFEDAQLALPECVRDASMADHEAWFKRVAHYWRIELEYGEEDEARFHPMITAMGCYMVFGIPCASDNAARIVADITLHRAGNEDGSRLIHIEEQPFYLDWFDETLDAPELPHSHEETERSLAHPLFDHPSFNTDSYPRKYRPRWAFIRPASPWDIRRALQLEVTAEPGEEAFVIKTNDIKLAGRVLENIVRRDLTAHTSASGLIHYVMAFDVSGQNDCTGLHLACDRYGEDFRGWSNRVLSSTGYEDSEGRRTMLHELDPSLLVMVDQVGKKTLLDAARHGLVVQRRAGFDASLEKIPAWCRQLPLTPEPIVAILEGRFAGLDMTWPELWSRVKIVKYRRDNI